MFIKEGIQSTKDKIEAATENWTSIFIPSNFFLITGQKMNR
jgi:hypothetical protein